jgi:hypothetical protein
MGSGITSDDYDADSFADDQTPWDESDGGGVLDQDDDDDGHGPVVAVWGDLDLDRSARENPWRRHHFGLTKPSPAWRAYYPLVCRALQEEWGPALESEIAEIRRGFREAARDLTYELIAHETAKELAGRKDPPRRCSGFENGCKCANCELRAELSDIDLAENLDEIGIPLSQIEVLWEEVTARVRTYIAGRERRGGARKRGEHGAMRVRLADTDLYRYDFGHRDHGSGNAGHDSEAIRAWLVHRVVWRDGRLWLVEGGPERALEDHAPALRPGPKTEGMQTVFNDLARRVQQLVDDGAYKAAIARELGDVSSHTVNRLLKAAKAAQTASGSHSRGHA